MPEKLICPKCNKASYTAAPDSYSPCPYCGFISNNEFSLGPDKRVDERFYWSSSCELMGNDKGDSHPTLITAKTEDISQTGLKIRYSGEKLLPGNQVNISVKDLNLETSAQIIWSKSINEDGSESGLCSLNRIVLPFNSEEGKPVFNKKSLLKEFRT